MSSGNTDPIRQPLRFHVGDSVYTLVTLAEAMYDTSGEELLTRVDHDRKLLILSDRCRGRHAVVATLTMLLSAWEHQRQDTPLNYEQLTTVASVMERFLVDMGLEDAAAQSLSAPKTIHQPSNPLATVRRGIAVAALITVIAGAWWSIATRHSPSPAAEPLSAITVSTPLPGLVQSSTLKTPSFPTALGATAAHPVDPAFAFATSNNEIKRTDLDGSSSLLAKTLAPVTWLSLSPDGQYLAACDLQNNLYLVSWDGHAEPQQRTAEGNPMMLSVQNDARVTWLAADASLYVTDFSAQTTTRLLGVEQAVHAAAGVSASALIRQANGSRTLEFQIDRQTLPLSVQLTPTQVIHDLDASADRRTLVALLSDGLVLVIRQHNDGHYRLQEHPLPAPFGFAQTRVSQDGRTALIVTDQLYRLDTQRLRITAQTPLPQAGGPVYDLAWRETLDEIAIARATEGAAWQP